MFPATTRGQIRVEYLRVRVKRRRLRYGQVGGDTIIQGNTNANTGNIEFELRLTGLHSPLGGDFIL